MARSEVSLATVDQSDLRGLGTELIGCVGKVPHSVRGIFSDSAYFSGFLVMGRKEGQAHIPPLGKVN